jgi:F0F1-type ATP synthase assembly protein I
MIKSGHHEPRDPPPESKDKDSLPNRLALYSVGGQIGCATILVVVVCLFIGIGLDTLLHTQQHVMVILFVLVAGPLALVVSYFLAMRAVKQVQANQKSPAKSEPKPGQEDEERE